MHDPHLDELQAAWEAAEAETQLEAMENFCRDFMVDPVVAGKDDYAP